MPVRPLKPSDEELLKRMREGDEHATKILYQKYYSVFVNWARKRYNSFPQDLLNDIYQEAFVVLYENVTSGKVPEINNVQAYLFRVGKYKINNALRRLVKTTDSIDTGAEEEGEVTLGKDDSIADQQKKTHQRQVVAKLLEQMGDPCKTVLELSFFKMFPPESIAAAMGYKTEATARVRKAKCLKQMGDLLDRMGLDDNYFY